MVTFANIDITHLPSKFRHGKRKLILIPKILLSEPEAMQDVS